MEFSSSSDDDETLERQLRRHRGQQMREESGVTRTSSRVVARGLATVHGRRSVVLPSGDVIESRRGTIYLPVRDRYVHINEAKAHPQRFFGDPSLRVAQRLRLAASRVVLKTPTPANGWREVRLPDASVSGVFVFDRVEGGEVRVSAPSGRTEGGPVDILGRLGGLSAAPPPPPPRPLDALPRLQRKIDLHSWVRGATSPVGFRCTADVSWATPDGRRQCSAATADMWGTVWGFDDGDQSLSVWSRRVSADADGAGAGAGAGTGAGAGAGGVLVKKVVAEVPLAGRASDSRTIGLACLPGYGEGSSSSDVSGAVALVSSHQVALVPLPQQRLPPDSDGVRRVAAAIACPVAELPYHCWCVTQGHGTAPFRARPRPLSQSSPFLSSVGLAVSSERDVVEVRFEDNTDGARRWGARQLRRFPKTARVTALGAVGGVCAADGEPRFLLAGMRSGTIQVCRSGGGPYGGSLDRTPRHHGASVISLHQLSTHECHFASVSSTGEVCVWDLRYFANAQEPVSVVCGAARMNYDGRVKVSWCGDLVAVVSEPGNFCRCANTARAGACFTLPGEEARLSTGDPTVLLTRTGAGYDLILFGDHHTRCISLDAA